MRPWRRRFADLAATLRGVERWLLPASCLLCGEPAAATAAEPLVCDLCRLRWRRVPHPLCARCGQPRDSDAECLVCQAWPPALGCVRSAVWLDGPARQAAHRLKYDGWWRIADAMAGAMRELEPLTGRISLVPVPLGARRLRRRGYNQSERIAAALGGLLGVPVLTTLLARVRETGTQTALAPDARYANVYGAFQAGAPAAAQRRGDAKDIVGAGDGSTAKSTGRLVLVDDVFTTGATLAAAASALAAAGAAQVDAVTFARAAPPIMNL